MASSRVKPYTCATKTIDALNLFLKPTLLATNRFALFGKEISKSTELLKSCLFILAARHSFVVRFALTSLLNVCRYIPAEIWLVTSSLGVEFVVVCG